MFADFKCVFDVITKCSCTKEKRPLIDMKSVRNAYHSKEILNIGLHKSKNSFSDVLSKVKLCASVKKLIKDNFSNFPIKQSIFDGDWTFLYY